MNAAFSTDYNLVHRLIKHTASRVMRRLAAMKVTEFDFDDVVGELNIAWCKARDKYDPNLGIPFPAYLQRGMFNHINRLIDNLAKERHLSIDGDEGLDGPGLNDHHEYLADDKESQHMALERKDMREHVLKRLSPSARRFVELLESPPPEVLDQVRALEARTNYAKSRGIHAIMSPGITSNLIFTIMDLTRSERARVMIEVKQLSKVVNQC